jgi:hypothetical protein
MSQDESQKQELTGAEIAQLAKQLFGPEEEWDDAEADFVLRLFGINPDTEDENAYAMNLLKKTIQKMRDKRKEVPQPLLDLLAKFEERSEKSVDQ